LQRTYEERLFILFLCLSFIFYVSFYFDVYVYVYCIFIFM